MSMRRVIWAILSSCLLQGCVLIDYMSAGYRAEFDLSQDATLTYSQPNARVVSPRLAVSGQTIYVAGTEIDGVLSDEGRLYLHASTDGLTWPISARRAYGSTVVEFGPVPWRENTTLMPFGVLFKTRLGNSQRARLQLMRGQRHDSLGDPRPLQLRDPYPNDELTFIDIAGIKDGYDIIETSLGPLVCFGLSASQSQLSAARMFFGEVENGIVEDVHVIRAPFAESTYSGNCSMTMHGDWIAIALRDWNTTVVAISRDGGEDWSVDSIENGYIPCCWRPAPVIVSYDGILVLIYESRVIGSEGFWYQTSGLGIVWSDPKPLPGIPARAATASALTELDAIVYDGQLAVAWVDDTSRVRINYYVRE